ncbi:MAG: cell wall hydrolase [Magnetospirillum sp.]|nr:cell wall hydrolase [Magnetospirillum sp.]
MDRWTFSVALTASVLALGHPIPAEAPFPSPEAEGRLQIQTPPRPRPQSPVSLAEFRCLALNVYYEARGEPQVGQLAVARVTLNRIDNGNFARSICGVVHQRNAAGVCQFGWFCRHPSPPHGGDAWRSAEAVAARALAGAEDPTRGALYFNRRNQRLMEHVRSHRHVVIGHQVFYR